MYISLKTNGNARNKRKTKLRITNKKQKHNKPDNMAGQETFRETYRNYCISQGREHVMSHCSKKYLNSNKIYLGNKE